MALAPEALRDRAASYGARERTHSINVGIEGMTCASCVGRVEKAIKRVPGVLDASVNLATECARITFANDDGANFAAAAQAIEAAGYETKVETIQFAVDGMSCASCVSRIENGLKAQPGVIAANVNLATEIATVRYLNEVVTIQQLTDAIRAAGYDVRLTSAGPGREDRDREARARELAGLRRSCG